MSSPHVRQVRLLYKTVLKLHKGMPPELQVIGDNYVKDEFKRHKKCKPEEAEIFIKEWSTYAVTLAKQLGLRKFNANPELGKPISEEVLSSLRGDQIHQLYELMQAARETPESEKDKIQEGIVNKIL